MEKSGLKILKWDSQFFKLKIGKIENSDNSQIEKFLIEYQLNGFDLVYVIKRGDTSGHDGPPIDIKYTYEIELSKDDFYQEKSKLSTIKIKFCREVSEQLYKLACQSGHMSRFKRDENFKEGEFERLYKTWIDNSLQYKIADYVIGAFESDKIIGFITLKIKDDFGEIGLFAVDNSYRNKGVGTLLIHEAKKISYENGKNILVVSTQKENHTACRFYEKNGFYLKSIESIYHYWLKI